MIGECIPAIRWRSEFTVREVMIRSGVTMHPSASSSQRELSMTSLLISDHIRVILIVKSLSEPEIHNCNCAMEVDIASSYECNRILVDQSSRRPWNSEANESVHVVVIPSRSRILFRTKTMHHRAITAQCHEINRYIRAIMHRNVDRHAWHLCVMSQDS